MRGSRVAGILLGLLLAAHPLGASAQGLEGVEIVTHPVAEGVYMLAGRGGNIGVSVGVDGIFLIDDQFAPLTAKIRAALAKLGGGEPRFVLNTHWHSDHTGGNENLGQAGALVLAHDHVRERMRVEQINTLGRRTPAARLAALPVVTFSERMTFHLNGLVLRVVHVKNAHTDGDSIVYLEGVNVVHMGDTFFSGRYPFIDLATGGSVDGTLAAAEQVLAKIDASTRLIPGHGPLATREDLVAYRDMLRTASARVRKLARRGKTLEQVQAAQPTAEYNAAWGSGFISGELFTELLYRDAVAD